jgi:YhcH/YjgK/YiaL family protein
MILDTIRHSSFYHSLGPLFKKAFDHLTNTDFTTLPNGKHAIEGDDLFVIVMEYETKDIADCIMENHKKYIDIQYMIRGAELMGITTFTGQVPITSYDETKEAAFYKKEYSSLIRVEQDQFAIFFPHDLHMPCIKEEKEANVRKAVYKVSVTKDFVSV